MSLRLNPYLNFAGDARQAMEFYREIFGGTLTMNTYSEFGAAEGADGDKIMHSQLDTDRGFVLMGADAPPGSEHVAGTNFAVSVTGDDAETLRGYWERLSADGTVQVPLEQQMWGDEFGQCVDRFGVGWMVNISQPQG